MEIQHDRDGFAEYDQHPRFKGSGKLSQANGAKTSCRSSTARGSVLSFGTPARNRASAAAVEHMGDAAERLDHVSWRIPLREMPRAYWLEKGMILPADSESSMPPARSRAAPIAE